VYKTRMKRALIPVVLLALVLAQAGCDRGSEAESPRSARAGGWEITVLDARAEQSLEGTEGRAFVARTGETFVVVVARFRNAGGGELEIATERGEIVDAFGDARPADGGGEEEVCIDCGVSVSTHDPTVTFRFVFALSRPLPERLLFRYAGSRPLPLPLEGTGGELAADAPTAAWTKVEPGGRTRCARGTPYAFWFHPGDPNKLLVYFQAGGGCFDAASCAPGSSLFDDSVTETDNPGLSENGILDLGHPENPFREHSVLYVPSCTGDVHWGDNVRTYTGAGQRVTVHHRGFVNASAAVDWLAQRVRRPSEVFVTGCSAGSVGSAVFAPYLIERYDEARVTQLGDSLAFVFHRPVDLQEDYRAHANFPAWIPDLRAIEPGEFTMARYYAALARHYPRSAFAEFNFARDGVQRTFYQALGGQGGDFPDALATSLAEIRAAAPNFRCYTTDGTGHCILNRRDFYTHETDGVRLRDWVAGLAEGRPVDNVGGA
jgi:Pectinacetylesterase